MMRNALARGLMYTPFEDDPSEIPPDGFVEGEQPDQGIRYDEYERNRLAPPLRRVQAQAAPITPPAAAQNYASMMQWMLNNPPRSPQQGAARLRQMEAEIRANPDLQTDMIFQGLDALKQRYGMQER